jgi:hypothetical protein
MRREVLQKSSPLLQVKPEGTIDPEPLDLLRQGLRRVMRKGPNVLTWILIPTDLLDLPVGVEGSGLIQLEDVLHPRVELEQTLISGLGVDDVTSLLGRFPAALGH